MYQLMLSIKLITVGLFFFSVFGFYLFQKKIINVDFESNMHEYVIIIFLFSVAIQQLIRISYTTFAAKTEQAKNVGKAVAERALDIGIETVVFDRGGYRYAGRVKALAEAAREGGLKF